MQTSAPISISFRSAKESLGCTFFLDSRLHLPSGLQVAPSFWTPGVSAPLQNSRIGCSGRNGTTLGFLGVFCQHFFSLFVFSPSVSLFPLCSVFSSDFLVTAGSSMSQFEVFKNSNSWTLQLTTIHLR